MHLSVCIRSVTRWKRRSTFGMFGIDNMAYTIRIQKNTFGVSASISGIERPGNIAKNFAGCHKLISDALCIIPAHFSDRTTQIMLNRHPHPTVPWSELFLFARGRHTAAASRCAPFDLDLRLPDKDIGHGSDPVEEVTNSPLLPENCFIGRWPV